jgi:hypothetical protein
LAQQLATPLATIASLWSTLYVLESHFAAFAVAAAKPNLSRIFFFLVCAY